MEKQVSLTEAEKVKKKVDEMYENYGIDPTSLDESDFGRVYRYYMENRKELDSDYEDSKRHAGLFDEDDII
jgi:hypothetical protein